MQAGKPMSVVVFAYNFLHRRTQDFLLHLFAEGIEVSHVLAANAVKLNIPPSGIRSKLRHTGLLHPEKISKAIGAQYHVAPHRGEEIEALLGEIQPELAVIAGARILKNPVIRRFRTGIINFHPGLIPEARGLDALLWSIKDGIPLGVTSHLIDERVDAGRVLQRREIPLHWDDTIFDLSERLYQTQLEMLMEAVTRSSEGRFQDVDYGSSRHNRKMRAEDEQLVLQELPAYLERMCS